MTSSVQNTEFQFQLNETTQNVIDQDLINEILDTYKDFNAKEMIKMKISGGFSQVLLDMILIIFNNAEYLEIVKPPRKL